MSLTTNFGADLAWLVSQAPTVQMTWRGVVLEGVRQRDEMAALSGDAHVAGNYTHTFTCTSLTDREPPVIGDLFDEARGSRATLRYAVTKTDTIGGGSGWKVYLKECGANG